MFLLLRKSSTAAEVALCVNLWFSWLVLLSFLALSNLTTPPLLIYWYAKLTDIHIQHYWCLLTCSWGLLRACFRIFLILFFFFYILFACHSCWMLVFFQTPSRCSSSFLAVAAYLECDQEFCSFVVLMWGASCWRAASPANIVPMCSLCYELWNTRGSCSKVLPGWSRKISLFECFHWFCIV